MSVTVIHAGGQNYALHTNLAQTLHLAHTARFLELRDGPDIIYLNANSITTISEWDDLPSHHGKLWRVADAAKPETRRPGRPRKVA